jgi:hypothetical protein
VDRTGGWTSLIHTWGPTDRGRAAARSRAIDNAPAPRTRRCTRPTRECRQGRCVLLAAVGHSGFAQLAVKSLMRTDSEENSDILTYALLKLSGFGTIRRAWPPRGRRCGVSESPGRQAR